MNRQNNLKIILTTVIVLVISAIAVFTVVNWAEIVKKFQGAAAKNDGFEKHERNTVQPSNVDTAVNSSEPAKDSSSLEEPKILHHPTESNTKSFSKFDEPLNPEVKDIKPIGLDDESPVKAKEPVNTYKPKAKEDFPLLADTTLDSNKKSFSPEKSVSASKGYKKFRAKKHHRRHRHSRIAKSSGLEKRVSYLEKKFGVKKPVNKKQASLANRVYRLEKLITKKKK